MPFHDPLRFAQSLAKRAGELHGAVRILEDVLDICQLPWAPFPICAQKTPSIQKHLSRIRALAPTDDPGQGGLSSSRFSCQQKAFPIQKRETD